VAPPALAGLDRGVPVEFSVNCVSPQYNSALVQEALLIDPRARDLVLLVRRWARDRGICHAARGHLAPYAWTQLAIYFLQVGVDGGALLPPLQGYKMVNRITVKRGGGEADAKRGRKTWAPPAPGSPAACLSVASLFRSFVRFYAEDIDWHKEAVSVRRGQRAEANLHLMVHMIKPEGKAPEPGPAIEDPFEPARNLGTSVSAGGAQRLRDELARARTLLEGGGDLRELLRPWVPPERERDDGDDGRGAAAEDAEDAEDAPRERG